MASDPGGGRTGSVDEERPVHRLPDRTVGYTRRVEQAEGGPRQPPSSHAAGEPVEEMVAEHHVQRLVEGAGHSTGEDAQLEVRDPGGNARGEREPGHRVVGPSVADEHTDHTPDEADEEVGQPFGEPAVAWRYAQGIPERAATPLHAYGVAATDRGRGPVVPRPVSGHQRVPVEGQQPVADPEPSGGGACRIDAVDDTHGPTHCVGPSDGPLSATVAHQGHEGKRQDSERDRPCEGDDEAQVLHRYHATHTLE